MMQNPAALHKREGSVTFCKAYFYELNYYVLSCAKFALVFHKLLQKIFFPLFICWLCIMVVQKSFCDLFCEGILFVELRGTRMCSEQRALYVVKATWFYTVLAAWNSCFSTTLPLLTLFSNHWKTKQRLKILSKLVYSFAAVTFIQEHIAVAVVIVLLKVLRKAKYSSHSHRNIMTLVLHYITT